MWDSKTGEIYRIKGNKQKKGGKRSEDFISVLVVVRFLTSRRPSSLVPTFVFTLFFLFFFPSPFLHGLDAAAYIKRQRWKRGREQNKRKDAGSYPFLKELQGKLPRERNASKTICV